MDKGGGLLFSFSAGGTKAHRAQIFDERRRIGETLGDRTMKSSKSYRDDLLKDLKDPKEALAYLNACLEGGHPDVFLLALKDVAEARGGMTRLSKDSRIRRASLYRILDKKGNPELYTLDSILQGLGFQITLVEKPPVHLRRAA